MNKKLVTAIYEKGVFRPLKNLKIAEGQAVQLTVEIPEKIMPEEMLKLAAQVYEGLSEEQIDDLEKIALERSNFFNENTP